MNSKDNSKKSIKKRKCNPFRFIVYSFIKWTGALSTLLWIRPKRLYESKAAKKHIRGGAVVVANHTGFSDPVSLLCTLWYRRPYFIAFQSLFEKKIARWFFRTMGCIPVDRDNFNMETFRASVDVLSKGKVLCIFPEGAINHDTKTVQSFKSGAVLMALKGGAPIVPIYVAPHTKWYHRYVTVVGEPIDINELTGGKPDIRAIDKTTERIHEKEIKLMEIYNAWKNKKSSN